jgi:Tol biopolymer transport system component
MKYSLLVGISLLAVLSATPQAQAPEVRLRAAQQKETVEGDLQTAIKMYRTLADDKTTTPDVAAQSLLRLGRCYERIGNTEARKAYERIVAQYAGQDAAVAEAKTRLAAMPANGLNAAVGGVSARKVAVSLGGSASNLSPTVTQDGRYTAVLRGRTTIELIDLLTGEQKPFSTARVASTPDETLYRPLISPDGRRVLVDVATGAHSSELRLVDRSTDKVRTVMRSDTAYRLAAMDWSHDGDVVLVKAMREASRDGQMYLLNVDEGKPRDLPINPVGRRIGARARLSPDGKYIAYSVVPTDGATGYATGRFGSIRVARIDGAGDQLIPGATAAILVGWTGDGRHVLFISDDLGTDHLWAVPFREGRSAGAAISVAKGLARSEGHAASPSGSLMLSIPGTLTAYTATIDPQTSSATGRPEPIEQVNGLLFNPAWSPDGKRLVYLVQRQPGEGNTPNAGAQNPIEIHVREEATGESRRLGTIPAVARTLTWTRDGKALVFPQRTNRGSALMRYWVEDGRTEELIPAAAGETLFKGSPKLSPDGKTLYYMETSPTGRDAQVIRYDLSSGHRNQIAVVTRHWDLAPGGQQLVVRALDKTSNQVTIRVINGDGQPVRELVRLGPDEDLTSLAWAPNGKWIYFTREVAGSYSTHRVPANGGPSVFTGLRTPVTDLVVHPDGGQIAFTSMTAMQLWRVDGLDALAAAKTVARRAVPNRRQR